MHPSRESCTARRERTNTPLQALLLLNEHQYLQAAKHLAIRVFRECESTEQNDRLIWLFETVTARHPRSVETAELASLLETLQRRYRSNHAMMANHLLSVDETRCDEIDSVDHAAWMVVCSTLLNLDEVINK